MAEYIEREAALSATCEYCSAKGDCLPNERCVDYENIKRIPAADVAPVRRGRWDDFKPDMPVRRKICSSCGYITNPWLAQVFNFCPICGAKMEETE